MTESDNRWLPIRGRRLLCRKNRATHTTALLPVLVYSHGGGWMLNSIDAHDRLIPEYSAAAGCVVIALDYALIPEAPFPQALKECAAVLDFLATKGGSWGSIALVSSSVGIRLAQTWRLARR